MQPAGTGRLYTGTCSQLQAGQHRTHQAHTTHTAHPKAPGKTQTLAIKCTPRPSANSPQKWQGENAISCTCQCARPGLPLATRVCRSPNPTRSTSRSVNWRRAVSQWQHAPITSNKQNTPTLGPFQRRCSLCKIGSVKTRSPALLATREPCPPHPHMLPTSHPSTSISPTQAGPSSLAIPHRRISLPTLRARTPQTSH